MIRSNILSWKSIESARQIQAFSHGDWQLMIIPSLQGNDDYHVIMDRVGENGVIVNRLMSKEEISDAYGIQV